MKTKIRFRNRRALGAVFAAGTLCQFGGCDLGSISATTTTTLDGRQVIISMIRGAILTPLDTFITNTVNDAFAQ